MLKKTKEGFFLGLGVFLFFGILFGLSWAVGFHTADEIVSGSFNGNFDFSSANVIGLDENETYSTSEIKTNKRWIDGKPIYKRVFTGSRIPDGTGSNNPLMLAGVDRVITFKGYTIQANNYTQPIGGGFNSVSNFLETSFYVNPSKELHLNHYTDSPAVYELKEWTIYAEYTKMSD